VWGAADGELRLWDVPSRRTLRTLSGHSGAVRGVSVNSDGSKCVSCGDDGRGLHSFRFQLNLSSSVHRVTQLNS
jgi:WD40 repeat protein